MSTVESRIARGAAPESAANAPATTDRLEAEARLAALARAGGPLRRVGAALAGRLVASWGWERLGYARLGDYARERLGLSARTLQELARVERALADLPRLEAALVAGRLPWSKVRLLARFATPGDEERWIAAARRLSVRALEREVRRVDRGALEAGALARSGVADSALATDEEGGDLEPVERVRIRGPAALSFQWQRTRAYAAQVAGGPVTPGAVLEMVTAELLSALPLDAAAAAGSRPVAADVAGSEAAGSEAARRAGGGEPGSPVDPDRVSDADPAAEPEGDSDPDAEPEADASASCDALPAFLQPLVDGLEEADAFALDVRLRRALRLEQRLEAELAPLLRQVTAAEYEWRDRFRTLAGYARERLGISPRKARALLRLERVADLCPELRAAWRDGALSWVQAQLLAPLLLTGGGEGDGDWRRAWLVWAPRVTVRRLEELVDRALLLSETEPEAWSRCAGHPERIAEVPGVEGGGATDRNRDACGDQDAERQTCARPTEFGRESLDAHGASGAPAGKGPPPGALRRLGADPAWEGWRITLVAPRDVAQLFRAALCTLRRALERHTGRMPSEGEAFGAMLDHALQSWGVDDPRLRRRLRRQLRTTFDVFERDGWRCTVPGCTSRRNLHAHHLVFRSAGGSDALANQTTLCVWHHLRGVHAGLVRIRGLAPHALAFELGLRPGRPPLARYRSGDRVA